MTHPICQWIDHPAWGASQLLDSYGPAVDPREMIDMKGRTAVVFGVANKRSIAWAIAQRLQAAGAQLAITYQNERLELEARDLIKELPNSEAFRCDVSRDEEIEQLFAPLRTRY